MDRTDRDRRKHGLLVRTLVAGMWLSAPVGCGGSSSANLGGFQSSIPAETQLAELSPAQSRALCTELQSFVNHSGFAAAEMKVLCLFAGELNASLAPAPLTNAVVQAACTSAYNQCLAQPTTFDCQLMAGAAGCTATVSEYEACLNETAKQVLEAVPSLPTCAALTAEQVNMLGTTPSPLGAAPASCEAFNAKCPGLAVGAKAE